MALNRILEMIIRGELTEGSTLSERWIAGVCSVSIVKAREYLKELLLYKIVEQMPQHYSKIVTFTDLQKQQVFAQRYQFESYAIEQLVEKLQPFSKEQREKLLLPLHDEMCNMEAAGKSKEFVAFTYADMHFHSAIAKIINLDLYAPWIENLFVSYFLTTQSRLFFGNALLNKPEPGEVILEESERILGDHSRIYDAILRCDHDDALDALRDHLTQAERHWEQALEKKGVIPTVAAGPKINRLPALSPL